MRIRLLLLVLLLVGAPPASGVGVHVSPDGRDTPACGTAENPCATIRYGLGQTAPGDSVLAHAGTYAERWLEIPRAVWLISADGPLAATIDSGDRSAVRFTDGAHDAGLVGFEVYGKWNEGPAGDGLVRVHDASRVTLRDCVLSDAPTDCDVVKVSGVVDGIVLENLVVFDPAPRTARNPCGGGPWFQENVDLYGRGRVDGHAAIRDVLVRGCWLFHTARGGDYLLYSKISVEGVRYEGNVFGPSAGGGCGNAAVGVGTSEAGDPDPKAPAVRDAWVRDNLFVGCQGDAALGVLNAADVRIVNNSFYDNSGPRLASVIMLRGNAAEVGAVTLLNNIFQANHPSRGGGRLIWARGRGPTRFEHDHNLYFDNVTRSDLPWRGERGGIYGKAPLFVDPVVPSTVSYGLDRIREIARGFVLSKGSPALGMGIDPSGEAPGPVDLGARLSPDPARRMP